MYIEKKNKYVLRIRIGAAVLFASCFMIIGCSAQNSGLYRISAAEEERSDEAEAEPGKEVDITSDADPGSTQPYENSDGTAAGGDTESQDPAEETAADVYVHVCGAVVNPGVYALSPDTRIFGAIEAAGGFTEEAAQDYVNLAMQILDGMKIVIPTVDELAGLNEDLNPGYGVNNGDAGELNSVSESGSTDGLININTADESELMTLTGIGEGKARAIISYREEHGNFKSIEEIKNVSGIGDATFNKFKDSITVGVK